MLDQAPAAVTTVLDADLLLAISPQFSAHATSEKQVLLLSEERSFRLGGRLYVALLPYLDGTKTAKGIIQAFAGRIAPERLQSVLQDMFNKNYIRYFDAEIPRARQALWAELGLDPVVAERHLAGQSVALVAGSKDDGSRRAIMVLRQGLAQAGLPVVSQKDARLSIVAVDDYLRRDLAGFNRRMRRAGRSWMLFKAGGSMPLFGPLFRPDGKICWACLSLRMIENRPGDAIVSDEVVSVRPMRAYSGATLALSANLASVELARALAAAEPADFERHVFSFNLQSRSFERHMVRLTPGCPVCGKHEKPRDILERAKQPPAFNAGPVLPQVDGGWRTKTAEQVVEGLGRYVSPITGIISGLVDRSPAKGLPVFNARQTNPVEVGPRQNRLVGRPSGAAGKGMTEIQAKASCLAEAMERYLCGYTGLEPRCRATWEQVKCEAPHPYSYLNYSERQYDEREKWNNTNNGFNWVGERFDESRAIEWTPAWSLSRNALRWLPTRYCYFGYSEKDEAAEANKFCRGDSNGCASGSTVEEAIVQGFFELIERDACGIWWYNRVARPAFDIENLEDPFVRRMLAHCRERKRGLSVLDLTNDLGLPVAIAVSHSLVTGKSIMFGLGAHFDAGIAVSRALAELNQLEAFDEVDISAKDKAAVGDEAVMLDWMRNHTLESDPYCKPDGRISLSHYQAPKISDLKQAVDACVRAVTDRGYDMIVLDQSRPEVEFAAARVVVPGLRHFWARFRDGRLYRAPVDLGWRTQPADESDLNPVPFFL